LTRKIVQVIEIAHVMVFAQTMARFLRSLNFVNFDLS